MKISSHTGPDGTQVQLTAETREETAWLINDFFVVQCKEIAQKFPLQDKNWRPEPDAR